MVSVAIDIDIRVGGKATRTTKNEKKKQCVLQNTQFDERKVSFHEKTDVRCVIQARCLFICQQSTLNLRLQQIFSFRHVWYWFWYTSDTRTIYTWLFMVVQHRMLKQTSIVAKAIE